MRQAHFFSKKRPFLKGFRLAGKVVFGIVAAAVFGLVFGYLVMVLWNWLMPMIFDLATITYWQAFGIVILAKLIFGAIGRGRDHWHDHDEPFHEYPDEHDYDDWKSPPFEKFRKYRYYYDFWKEEGKEAFARYVKNRAGEASGDGNEESGE